MRFLVRLVINAIALWVAVRLVQNVYPESIGLTGGWLNLLLVALVFGVLNAVVRPILFVMTCPLQILTLGLFTLVLNAIVFWLTSVVSRALGLGFAVHGFLPALLGALIVSVVSIVLSIFVGDDREGRRPTRR
jgi:putative membrane protein